jgi:circadian clock protein KaiC
LAAEAQNQKQARPVSTGSPPLDYILTGGYASNRVHLLEGAPGSGKTTLGLQFLLDGKSKGERCLYITLSESRDELIHVASTHGWDLDGIEIFELVPPELSLDVEREQSIVYASDLELGETVQMVRAEVERVAPSRIVFDSLSDIRLLAQGPLRFRRQVLALKHFFAQRNCTALFLDDLTEGVDDLSLHSLAHGVVRLEQIALHYGAERRRLRVYKMRGRAFHGGFHDFVIRRGGVQIFPRLVASSHPDEGKAHRTAESGVAELDTLVGGALDYGTTTLIIGPSGSGKSTLAMQYVRTALQRGEKALFISFDETRRIFFKRAAGLGMDLESCSDSGSLVFRQVDPAALSPGELTELIREQVEQEGADVVVLDSLTGYQHAMPQEQFMLLQMHEITTYLNQQGILTFLILAQSGMVGHMQSPIDLTYLADSVVLLRFYEAEGEIRRALSVLKKRTGRHETTIRELSIDGGVKVGPSLNAFRGVLTGVPVLVKGGEERGDDLPPLR